MRSHLRWWRDRIVESNASVLIADVAPFALLAAQGLQAEGWQIKTILPGTGYSTPPADLPTHPLLLPDVTRLGHDEAQILAQLNDVLTGEGIDPLPSYPAILRCDVPFATSIPLLEPYADARGAWPCLPPLDDLPPLAQDGAEEVFVYVSTDTGRNPAVLGLLADLPLPRRGYIPGLSADQAQALTASGMILHDRPLPLSDIASRSRLSINLGQHGTLIMGALMGLPQVSLTQHLEHLFHARKLEAQGVCVIRRPHQMAHEEVRAAILTAYHDAGMAATARALAAGLRAAHPADVAAVRLARLAPAAQRARIWLTLDLQKRHQLRGRAILARRTDRAFQHRLQRQRQFLSQLYPPLVIRVYPQDHAFDEHPMFIKRDDLAQREGHQPVIGQHGRGAVAGKDAVAGLSFQLFPRQALRSHQGAGLIKAAAFHQGFGLGQAI